MQRLFPPRLALGLSAGLCLLALAPAAPAQDKPEKVKFETFDQAELQGQFYPSAQGRKAACVLLIHPVGGKIQDEGWDGLASALQKEGFAVLAFDLRGHGNSTEVQPNFWLEATNKSLKGYRPARPKTTISYKDFTRAEHYYGLINDVAAAKRFLDKKNDSGECNSSNVLVVGADSGAALGMAWIATEWLRRRINQVGVLAVASNTFEGQDIAAGVWISPNPALSGNQRINLSECLRNQSVREKVPMYFLYGEKDKRSESLARSLEAYAKPEGKTKKLWGLRAVPNSNTLAGRDLLKPSLGTTELVVKYAKAVMDERTNTQWIQRDVDKSPALRVFYPSGIAR